MGYIGHRDTGQWGTGGMGHMGNEAHWGYGVQRYMGHMGNRGTEVYGAHGQ